MTWASDRMVTQWETGTHEPVRLHRRTGRAAVGGVTTLLDHPLIHDGVVDRATYDAQAAIVLARTRPSTRAPCRRGRGDTSTSCEGCGAAGRDRGKGVHLPDGTPLDVSTIRRSSRVFARLGAIRALALIHAEDRPTLDANEARLRAEGRGRR